MDALIAASNQELREDDGPLGMHGGVGDPVLLRERGGRVDYELVRCLVELRRRLHLHRVVACIDMSARRSWLFQSHRPLEVPPIHRITRASWQHGETCEPQNAHHEPREESLLSQCIAQ